MVIHKAAERSFLDGIYPTDFPAKSLTKTFVVILQDK